MPDIIVYSSPTCAPCKTVKMWLNRKNIEFTEKIRDDNLLVQQELVKLTGRIGVPVIVVDNEVVDGANITRLAALLTT